MVSHKVETQLREASDVEKPVTWTTGVLQMEEFLLEIHSLAENVGLLLL